MSGIEVKIIEDRVDLAILQPQMQKLFASVFGRKFTDAEWDHYYLNCPYGTATAFACFDKEVLVGFGGVIPQRLFDRAGNSYDYYLQTAIMIKKEYQNLVLFDQLMQSIHAYVCDRNSFVVAFPNDNTFLPFTKMFGWVLAEQYEIHQYVAGDKKKEIGANRRFVKNLRIDD